LVMGVLNDALEKHPHPEIFNTDQGSQYTSEIHTKRFQWHTNTYKCGAEIEKQCIYYYFVEKRGAVH
jgi:hypothetical protein